MSLVAIALCSLVAVSAFAQLQTGNIYGKVQAKDGSVLPGVTVTLTGVGAPQVFVSDAQGNFRFISLSPGSYTLKADLAGYGTATRTGITVNVGRNADVTLSLNPSVSESITVTAEAPLLDVRKAGTAISVAKVELEKIPTSRDPWTILQQAPAVQVDRLNVGGSQSGQQSVYIGKGATSDQNTWNVDGVNITDMGATGSTPLYFDFDSFEEMQITTGGSDPRIMTPGVQLNMVTKRGTNDFRGSSRYFYTPGSYQANATVPAEAATYLQQTNAINFVRDYGVEVGGPVWKDHLWLWVADSINKISNESSITIPAPGSTAGGSLDNIIGFLPVKSVVHVMQAGGELDAERLRALLRPPYFVPLGTPLLTQLQQFQADRQRLGLVVDEYGELQGLVTIEDIIEEIIGEFTTQAPGGSESFRREADGSIVVDGMAPLRTLNRRLGTQFALDGPKTLNGLIVEHLGDIPDAGMSFKIEGQGVEILQTQDRAVKVVRLLPPVGRVATPLQTQTERASS